MYTLNMIAGPIPIPYQKFITEDTKHHAARVAVYGEILHRRCVMNGVYSDSEYYSEEYTRIIHDILLYHDIGKLQIPLSIIRAPRKLSLEELNLIRRHTINIRKIMIKTVKDHDEFFGTNLGQHIEILIAVASQHHEHWDGMGYPFRLAGQDINPIARLCTICDSLDAMTAPRPYHSPISWQDAVGEVSRCAGTQFDPELVDTVLDCVDDFETAERSYDDLIMYAQQCSIE